VPVNTDSREKIGMGTKHIDLVVLAAILAMGCGNLEKKLVEGDTDTSASDSDSDSDGDGDGDTDGDSDGDTDGDTDADTDTDADADADTDTDADADTDTDADTDADTDSDADNYAVRLDGADDYVSVPDATALDLFAPWTVEGWVELATSDLFSSRPFIRKGDSYGVYYLYVSGLLQGAYGGFAYDTNGDSVSTGMGMTTLAAGVWHHIALVDDGATLSLFVDGALENDTDSTGYEIMSNGSSLVFGANLSSGYYLDGLIDEIRISSTARYSAAFTPQAAFAVDGSTEALWHFDEGAGTTATDAASGLAGTLNGGAVFEAR
jgi:hypothetical protein